MKTLLTMTMVVLAGLAANAQNDLSGLKQLLYADRTITGNMNANEKRAVAFEQTVGKRLLSAERRANALSLRLSYPEIKLTAIFTTHQSRYRHGSLSTRAMDAYEHDISLILSSLESQVSVREQALHQAWRQANPVEARIEDAENAAAAAESRASASQAEAEEKERMAREAENRARQAEALARQREQEAQRQEERARELEWQAQQAEQRAREAESRSRW